MTSSVELERRLDEPEGVKSADVVEMVGCSYSTVAAIRATSLGVADPTPQPTEPCGLFSTESGGSVKQTALFDDFAGAPPA